MMNPGLFHCSALLYSPRKHLLFLMEQIGFQTLSGRHMSFISQVPCTPKIWVNIDGLCERTAQKSENDDTSSVINPISTITVKIYRLPSAHLIDHQSLLLNKVLSMLAKLKKNRDLRVSSAGEFRTLVFQLGSDLYWWNPNLQNL